jgi:mRNA interferase MazF
MLDLGYEGKTRPIVILSREDPDAPRALALFVPLTSQSKGSAYEVRMPQVPWLRVQSYANVQAIGSVSHHELLDRRGRFDSSTIERIRDAIRFVFDL